MFTRFLRCNRGDIAPIFAIAMIPVIVAAGGAVDYSRAYDQKTVVQDSLDTAALAASRKIGLVSDAELMDEAESFFDTNIGNKIANPPQLTMNVSAATMRLTTQLNVKTYFLGLIGLDQITFNIASEVTSGMGTLEVVMVLDNSGSMAGTKLSTLKTAAGDLTTTLFNLSQNSTKEDPLKIGLVPFAGSVNVGPGYASASWMDTTGIATYHGDSMDDSGTTVNNFSLLSAMNNQSWGGCVEERPMPYDVSDDTPTTSTPATMFVPMFAPDAPDNWTCNSYTCNCYYGACSGAPGGSYNDNNYLPDNGGSCSGSTDTAKTSSYNEQAAFKRTCKYDGATPTSITVAGIAGGPNFMCTTAALTPLTTNQTTVTSGINSMIASGSTNIQAGLTWGWRVLSPSEPFTEGRAYNTEDNTKILILMTDGENTYYPRSNFLKSWYGAWGYVFKGHLGTTSTYTSTLVSKMNERTALACDNIKAAGITIYTVAFQVSDSDTLSMLETCASDSDKAFQSSSTAALAAAFTAIGDDISSLRLSK